jgi:hypothetical protein
MPHGKSWLHKLRSGPNPIYSPEILFFVAITAVSALGVEKAEGIVVVWKAAG